MPLRVLLVDDDQIDREIFKRALAATGVRSVVSEFVAAEPLLDVSGARNDGRPDDYDIAFFDLQLPGRDGLELLRDLRTLGVLTPIIFLTGHGNEDTAVELMKAGAADYLPKNSLSPARLLQSIGHTLRLARLERAQRESERALRESELGFRRLAEHLPDAVVRFDRDGRHTYVNRPVPWSRFPIAAEVVGTTLAQGGCGADIVTPLQEALDRSLAGEAVQITLQLPGSAPLDGRLAGDDDDGPLGDEASSAPEERWFEVRFVPETSTRNGGPSTPIDSVLAIARDVTSRVLHERDEQRRIEFEHQLIGIVSHDLRNPIGAILMGATLLDKKISHPRETAVARALEVLNTSAQRARRMVNDILDFTRARLGGGIPMQLADIDLAEVVSQLVAETRTVQPGRHIALEVDGSARGHFDGDRVAQALSNLLGNALAYSPPDETVTLRVTDHLHEVRVEVKNRGPTIPAEVLPMLFKPFQRGPATGGHGGGGRSVGLGLFIVEQIAHGHRGRIEVESQDGTTCFRLVLPRRSPSGRMRALTVAISESPPS